MNGKQSIIATLNERGIPNAAKVVEYYLAEGIATFNSVGQFSVKHGALLDTAVLMRASDKVNE